MQEETRRALIKQDVNFLEFGLFFQDERWANSVKDFTWRNREGFVYRALEKPPTRRDMLFLLALLHRSQKEDWKDEVKISRFELLKECGFSTSKSKLYTRIEESLRRWKSVEIEFQGTFYDGEEYSSVHFGIIDRWSFNKTTKQLEIRFSPEWLACLEYSTFFEMLDFERLKALRSPLAMRLYEILVKTFRGRTSWKIYAINLAAKIPMPERYVSHIIPKIQTAINVINEKTELAVSLHIGPKKKRKVQEEDDKKRVDALLIFRKENAALPESVEVEEAEEADTQPFILHLLSLVREKERGKKAILQLIEESLKAYDIEYIEQNILYANEKSKENYKAFLSGSLKENWSADWWEDVLHRQAQEEQSQANKQQSIEEDIQSLDAELSSLSEEFASLTSGEELEKVQSQVREEIAVSNDVPVDQVELHFRYRMIGKLQNGIAHYKMK